MATKLKEIIKSVIDERIEIIKYEYQKAKLQYQEVNNGRNKNTTGL